MNRSKRWATFESKDKLTRSLLFCTALNPPRNCYIFSYSNSIISFAADAGLSQIGRHLLHIMLFSFAAAGRFFLSLVFIFRSADSTTAQYRSPKYSVQNRLGYLALVSHGVMFLRLAVGFLTLFAIFWVAESV